jgi:hypothetical protein
MQTFKALTLAAAGMLIAGAATAVTVKNTSKSDVTIGIDWGHQEKVETVPAAKSVSFECKEGCGVTGPWGFSQMASGTDEISTDGKILVTVGSVDKARTAVD